MFVRTLAQKIDGWQGSAAPFIQVPATKRVLSRGKAYRSIQQIAVAICDQVQVEKPAIGLCFEDPTNWILATIATHIAGAVSVPIPKEFTGQQISSFVPNLDLVLTDSVALATKISAIIGSEGANGQKISDAGELFLLKASQHEKVRLALPGESVGVIHTSGSTDFPKGVVIGDEGLQAVVDSMKARLQGIGPVRYASILPMSLLLEQVLGIFIPIFTDGSVSVLPASTQCYTGTQAELDQYLSTIRESGANFSMVPPSFLADLTKRALANSVSPRAILGDGIEVLATGGAPIEPETLKQLKRGGLEVFQGYGLSENTSVVAWTYPGPNSIGSVGRPLDHNEVRINNAGQVEVQGSSVFLGYVSRGRFKLREQGWLNTGDNGFFDSDGGLHITGRDSNLIVLSSGRNVSPEWVEGKFKSIASVKDILLLGHGKPFLSALVLVDKGFECEAALGSVIRHAEKIKNEFPEFSRIEAFRALPFDDQYYSVSGRVLRKQVLEMNQSIVNDIYSSKKV